MPLLPGRQWVLIAAAFPSGKQGSSRQRRSEVTERFFFTSLTYCDSQLNVSKTLCSSVSAPKERERARAAAPLRLQGAMPPAALCPARPSQPLLQLQMLEGDTDRSGCRCDAQRSPRCRELPTGRLCQPGPTQPRSGLELGSSPCDQRRFPSKAFIDHNTKHPVCVGWRACKSHAQLKPPLCKAKHRT